MYYFYRNILSYILLSVMGRRFSLFLPLCILVAVSCTDAATTNRPCHSETNCLDNECCVSINQPIGRRQLEFFHSGHCIPMGLEGDGCLVRTGNATTRPTGVVLSCPCTPGLYCHGDHLYVVPLGEQGHCVSP